MAGQQNRSEMNENRRKLQLELLMEKLRHKTSHLNLAETAKAFKMTILVRRLSGLHVPTLAVLMGSTRI